jgi:hypothetical protein
MIASADATREAQFDQIPLEDGIDHGQMRKCLTVAIEALGRCVIHDFDNEVDFIEFCATTWPGEKTARLRAAMEAQKSAMGEEAEIALAEKFSNLKKQIEAFVLDRAKEALASSRVMNSNWHKILETLHDNFASDMNSLEASATTNQAKVRALGPINDAFSMGVLIGRSVSDEEVTQILAAGKSVGLVSARREREKYDEYADAKLTDAVAKAVGPGKTPPPVSDRYVRSIESAVREELKLADPKMIRKSAGWPKLSTIKIKVGLIAFSAKVNAVSVDPFLRRSRSTLSVLSFMLESTLPNHV